MGKTRAAYPPEFRLQMVDLVRVGHSPEELAREFEPTAQSIMNWLAQCERNAGRGDGGLTNGDRPPRCLTVTLDEFVSIAGYHRKHMIWRRCFRRCGGPTWTSIAPCSVSSRTSRRCAPVPQAASWTRPARDALPEAGRLRGMVRLVSPRNAIWILDPEKAASEAMVTSQHGQFRTSLDMADISNWSSASAGVCQASVFRGLVLRAAATAAMSSALCMLSSVPLGTYWRSSPLVFSLVPRCHGL